MELISGWSRGAVRAYLQGLDPSVQHYPFKEWDITGQDLLDLSPQHLDALGVKSIGHQEVILEAVEQLCALHYDLHRESLRSLTDKLHRVAQLLCSHIIALKKASSVSQPSAVSPTHKQLASIIDIVAAARGLFSWLNRYLFTRLNDYSASRDVIALCVELAEMLHKDWTDPKVEARILTICENIGVICKSILNCSPESLLNQTATLELVQIHPKPSDGLGLVIKSTSSGQHFVGQTVPESAARECEQILPGDEIIKVNDQVVVGWTHKNLVRKLQEKLNCVTLILKKVSVSPAKSPVSSNKNKTPEASPSSLMDSSPFSSPVPTSPNVRGRDLLLKSNSAPVSPLKHKNLLVTQSAPGFETEHKLTSIKPGSGAPQNLEQASSADISGVSQNRPSRLASQGNHTWSCPGALSKPLTSDVFLSLPPTSPELPAQLEMSCSTIYAKTLIPLEPCSSEMESKNVKHSSRPRSGSDSTSPPGKSLLEPSSANLRPSASDSSLSKKTVTDVPQQSKRLETSSQSSQEKAKSPKTEKKLHLSDTDKHSGFDEETSDRPLRNQKATKLSRRRVSCRDLGSPDCDGWLWKKKENVGFMSQKWKHCYCVLKKDKLYWYNGPQDDKALGMLKLSSYYLESPLESKHKKKYEFQLTHQKYKPFIFAADNLTDMNKWVTCLVKTLQKYKTHVNPNNSREEDCYSETEAEDDDHSKAQDVVKKQTVQSPLNITPGASPVYIKEKGAEGVQMPNVPQSQVKDDLELMMTCLKQGGVSLIGKKTAMTRDEYRKSFIKRNKNPDINRKAHVLRVLQSTLKAKLQELEALNQILEHPTLDSTIFRKWKSEHDQLYCNVRKGSQAAAENVYSMDGEGSNDQKKQDSDDSEASD